MNNENPERIPVFVYGTLMTGERAASLLPVPRQPAVMTGTLYNTGHGYPAYSPVGDATVHGEYAEIDSATLARLDWYEGYPSLYTREFRPAIVSGSSSVRPVWVYVMRQLPPGAVEIPSGRWEDA